MNRARRLARNLRDSFTATLDQALHPTAYELIVSILITGLILLMVAFSI